MDELEKAVLRLELKKVKTLVEGSLDQGEDPMVILKALNMGMSRVGELYERREYFLTELIMSGEIMKDT